MGVFLTLAKSCIMLIEEVELLCRVMLYVGKGSSPSSPITSLRVVTIG